MITEQLNIPSPLHKVETSWVKQSGCELYVKRDDLIHPLISGNKWRKLSGIIQKAKGYDTIKTFGGAFSNHLVATAVVAAGLGKKSIGVVRGQEPESLSKVLELCKLYGMHLQFVTREEYAKAKHQNELANNVLTIAEGGAHPEALVGCARIVNELEGESFDKLVVCCGTGTTYAGLYKELKKSNQEKKLFGVQVLKGLGYISREVKDTFNITSPQIFDSYHLGGYAKTNSELMHLVKDFAQETGVLLDPIYTAKAVFAIRDLVQQKEWVNEKIILLHTGGLTGWFGKWNELNF